MSKTHLAWPKLHLGWRKSHVAWGGLVAPPIVESVDPDYGTVAGGTAVTITGQFFQSGATVQFNGNDATDVVFVDAQTITCVTPAHIKGLVDVTVTNPDSQSGTLTDGYGYTSFADNYSVADPATYRREAYLPYPDTFTGDVEAGVHLYPVGKLSNHFNRVYCGRFYIGCSQLLAGYYYTSAILYAYISSESLEESIGSLNVRMCNGMPTFDYPWDISGDPLAGASSSIPGAGNFIAIPLDVDILNVYLATYSGLVLSTSVEEAKGGGYNDGEVTISLPETYMFLAGYDL